VNFAEDQNQTNEQAVGEDPDDLLAAMRGNEFLPFDETRTPSDSYNHYHRQQAARTPSAKSAINRRSSMVAFNSKAALKPAKSVVDETESRMESIGDFDNLFQNVNYDYLKVRQYTLRQKSKLEERKQRVGNAGRRQSTRGPANQEQSRAQLAQEPRASFASQASDESIYFENLVDDEQVLQDSSFYRAYRERKRKLGCCSKLYLKLRRLLLNPVLLSFEHERKDVGHAEQLKMVQSMEKGERHARSDIELAIIEDLRAERAAGVEPEPGKEYDENVRKATSFSSLLWKYLNLCFQMFNSNMDSICYILMIYVTLQNAGLVTLIYPLSVFGYANLMETGPSKYYWYLMMIYTQVLLCFEFTVAVWWSDEDHGALSDSRKRESIKEAWAKYHTGLRLSGSDTLQSIFLHFHPEIFLLLSMMLHI